MSNNPFRRQNVGENGREDELGDLRNGKSMGMNGDGFVDGEDVDKHIDQASAHGVVRDEENGAPTQAFTDPSAVQNIDGARLATGGQNGHQAIFEEPSQSSHVLTNSYSSPTNGNEPDQHSESYESPQLPGKPSQVSVQRLHAHVPSISQVRKESLANSRPPYIRAPSSQMPESIAPKMTPGEAHAEALKRLGKAQHTVKTLKRRGSNESLSSLLSYSIRRPSISARPENGYSLDALAHILEDAAQEGNLPLVEALFAMGVNPNFRSVNRLKNRRHDALDKAVAAGHVEVIDYLLRQGATFKLGETAKKDPFEPIDYKLLDVAYAGYTDVARYLIANQGANPFVEEWPREYYDARRTVYRRVDSKRIVQRTVLDALARVGSPGTDTSLLDIIIHDPNFSLTSMYSQIYTDTPYAGDGTRMTQTTHHFSALSLFVRAGDLAAVQALLNLNSHPEAYEKQDESVSEEGQIPSTTIMRYIWPVNALSKEAYTSHPAVALEILKLLVAKGFDVKTAQHTPSDSAPRSPLSRAILANSPSAVSVLVSHRPELVNEDISFRLLLKGNEEKEFVARPLAASLIQGSLECARVLLGHGANITLPTFGYNSVVDFAAGHGVASILPDFISLKPEMLGTALEMAVRKGRVESVRMLLKLGSEKQIREAWVWEMVMGARNERRDEDAQRRFEEIVEIVREAIGEKKVSKGLDVGV